LIIFILDSIKRLFSQNCLVPVFIQMALIFSGDYT